MWFQIGEAPKVTFTVTDLTLDPPAVADPTTVTILIKPPVGDIETYTYGVGDFISKSSTGVYTARIALTMGGRYYVRWKGSGGVAAAAEGFLDVEQSAFPSP